MSPLLDVEKSIEVKFVDFGFLDSLQLAHIEASIALHLEISDSKESVDNLDLLVQVADNDELLLRRNEMGNKVADRPSQGQPVCSLHEALSRFSTGIQQSVLVLQLQELVWGQRNVSFLHGSIVSDLGSPLVEISVVEEIFRRFRQIGSQFFDELLFVGKFETVVVCVLVTHSAVVTSAD